MESQGRSRLKLKINKSDLEEHFTWYCEELINAGMIEKYNPRPMTRVVSEPVYYKSTARTKKEVVKTLLLRHEYTPDGIITWNPKAKGIMFRTWDMEKYPDTPFVANLFVDREGNKKYTSIIEIKPGFDRDNMQRLFSINQKWIMEKMKIYVQKIIISNTENCIFAKTFTPIRWMVTEKQGKAKTIHFRVLSVRDYIEMRQKLFGL